MTCRFRVPFGPPKPKATLYETGRFWLTANARFVLTHAEKFFLIETERNGLTASERKHVELEDQTAAIASLRSPPATEEPRRAR